MPFGLKNAAQTFNASWTGSSEDYRNSSSIWTMFSWQVREETSTSNISMWYLSSSCADWSSSQLGEMQFYLRGRLIIWDPKSLLQGLFLSAIILMLCSCSRILKMYMVSRGVREWLISTDRFLPRIAKTFRPLTDALAGNPPLVRGNTNHLW